MQMIGGPIDGAYLPVQPSCEQPPTQLAVWCPEIKGWCAYIDRAAGGVAIVDVYKLCDGIKLPTMCPPDTDAVSLHYNGQLSKEEMAEITRLQKGGL